jgi:hypothetical protein
MDVFVSCIAPSEGRGSDTSGSLLGPAKGLPADSACKKLQEWGLANPRLPPPLSPGGKNFWEPHTTACYFQSLQSVVKGGSVRFKLCINSGDFQVYPEVSAILPLDMIGSQYIKSIVGIDLQERELFTVAY